MIHKIGDRVVGRHATYEILQILGGPEGHGNVYSKMGLVYVVFSPELQTIVAVKSFHDRFLDSPEARAIFKQEALTWTRLDRHPNIVRAHWVEEIAGRLYIVLEYIAHDEYERNRLTDYLNGKPLPEPKMLCWALQFCNGMKHANNHGMLFHRDIKPDNIMISSEGAVKITDFGLGAVIEHVPEIDSPQPRDPFATDITSLPGVNADRIIGGTPGYHAPELVKGKDAGVQSDIFSFGVVLYQMATGSNDSPFLPCTLETILRLEALPKLNTPFWPIIIRCLESDLSRRFSDFNSMHNNLMALTSQISNELYVVSTPIELEAAERNAKGVSLGDLGYHRESIAAYKEAIEINPTNAVYRNNLGVAYEKCGEKEKALQCYDKAIEIDPKLAMAWNNRGNVLHALGRVELARRSYETALQINDEYSLAWNNLGWLLLDELDENKEAVRCLKRALEINPNYDEAWNNLGLAYMNLKKQDDAIQAIEMALKINPQFVAALVNKASWFFEQGRYLESQGISEKALRIDPNRFRAHNNLGLAFHALGDFDNAIASFDRALRIERNHMVLVNKANTLLSMSKPTDAIPLLKEALQQKPKEAKYHDSLGVMFRASGDMATAKMHHLRAIELDGTEPWFRYNLGVVLAALGDLTGAIAAHRKAITLNPDFAEAHHDLGANLHRTKDYEGAIEAYHRAIKLNDKNHRMFNNLALSLVALDRDEEALPAYQKAIELMPEYAEAHYNLGVLLLRQDENAAAKNSFEKAVKHNPTHFQALNNLGVEHLKEGDYAEAITWFEKALKINPQFFEAAHNLEVAKEALSESPISHGINEPIWDVPFNGAQNLQSIAVGAQEQLVGLLAKDHCEIWEGGKDVPGFFDFPWAKERNKYQSMAFSMNGETVFAVGGRVCMIYDRRSRVLSEMTLTQPITGIWVCADNQHFAVQQDSGHFMIFRLMGQQVTKSLSFQMSFISLGTLTPFSFSRDGKYIVVADSRGRCGFETRDLATGSIVQSLICNYPLVVAPRFSTDGKSLFCLAVIDTPYTLIKWNLASGKMEHVDRVKGPSDGLMNIVFSPFGSYYAGIDERKRIIDVFNVALGARGEFGANISRHLVFSPDERYIAAISSDNVINGWKLS